jgi:hypothetical protein
MRCPTPLPRKAVIYIAAVASPRQPPVFDRDCNIFIRLGKLRQPKKRMQPRSGGPKKRNGLKERRWRWLLRWPWMYAPRIGAPSSQDFVRKTNKKIITILFFVSQEFKNAKTLVDGKVNKKITSDFNMALTSLQAETAFHTNAYPRFQRSSPHL